MIRTSFTLVFFISLIFASRGPGGRDEFINIRLDSRELNVPLQVPFIYNDSDKAINFIVCTGTNAFELTRYVEQEESKDVKATTTAYKHKQYKTVDPQDKRVPLNWKGACIKNPDPILETDDNDVRATEAEMREEIKTNFHTVLLNAKKNQAREHVTCGTDEECSTKFPGKNMTCENMIEKFEDNTLKMEGYCDRADDVINSTNKQNKEETNKTINDVDIQLFTDSKCLNLAKKQYIPGPTNFELQTEHKIENENDTKEILFFICKEQNKMDLTVYMPTESAKLHGLRNGTSMTKSEDKCQTIEMFGKYYFVTSTWTGACTADNNSALRDVGKGFRNQQEQDKILKVLPVEEPIITISNFRKNHQNNNEYLDTEFTELAQTKDDIATLFSNINGMTEEQNKNYIELNFKIQSNFDKIMRTIEEQRENNTKLETQIFENFEVETKINQTSVSTLNSDMFEKRFELAMGVGSPKPTKKAKKNDTDDDLFSISTWTIVGIVAGYLVSIIITIAVMRYCMKQKKVENNSKNEENDEILENHSQENHIDIIEDENEIDIIGDENEIAISKDENAITISRDFEEL